MRPSHRKRGDTRAVSPVIATILLVAITVVMASVLYVMVSSYRPASIPDFYDPGETVVEEGTGSVTISSIEDVQNHMDLYYSSKYYSGSAANAFKIIWSAEGSGIKWSEARLVIQSPDRAASDNPYAIDTRVYWWTDVNCTDKSAPVYYTDPGTNKASSLYSYRFYVQNYDLNDNGRIDDGEYTMVWGEPPTTGQVKVKSGQDYLIMNKGRYDLRPDLWTALQMSYTPDDGWTLGNTWVITAVDPDGNSLGFVSHTMPLQPSGWTRVS